MLICIARLLRATAVDMTGTGKEFMDVAQELRKEIPEMNTGKVEPERKEEVLQKITTAYRNFIKEKAGHGLSKEKAEEMYTIIKDMEVKGNFKGLVTYPYNFALAWKHQVFAEMLQPSTNL